MLPDDETPSASNQSPAEQVGNENEAEPADGPKIGRRGALGSIGKFLGKQAVYGTVGAVVMESSNGGNWHDDSTTGVVSRRAAGAVMGIVTGNIVERKMKKDKEEREV